MATIPIHTGYTVMYGTGSGSNGNRIKVWVEYQIGQQDTVANTTAFTAYFYAALAPGYTSTTKNTTGLNAAFQVDGIAGTGVSNGSYDFTSTANVHTLGSFQGKLPHNTDGSKTLSVTGSFTTKSTYISGGSIRFTIPLPTIPRASTVGATDGLIGQVAMIAIGAKSNRYTHTLAFSFGNLSGFLDADGQITDLACKLPGTAVAFPLPESFYEQIPNALTGVCTLTCTTYQGDTVIGQPQTGKFTVSAANAKPQVSGTVEDICPVTLALTGDASRFIRYHSTAHCLLQASAQKSATVAQTSINAITTDSLDILGFDGASPVFAVKDSRGLTASYTCPTDLIAYTHLTANPTVKRDSPTADTATVTLSGSCFQGNFGQQENVLQLSYQVNDGESIQADAPITWENGRYSCVFSIDDLPYTANQKIRITVQDALETVTRELTVHKGTPVFDWGEQDFAFHVPVTLDSTVNGIYIETVRVWGSNSFRIKGRYNGPGEAGSRQSILLFGQDNHLSVSGLLCLHSDGNVQWSGTEGITVTSMDETGYFTVNMPATAYDYFIMISAGQIQKG